MRRKSSIKLINFDEKNFFLNKKNKKKIVINNIFKREATISN